MTAKELDKIKKELYEKSKDNYNKIRDYDERMRMSKVNQKDYKIGTTLAASTLPYFVTIFILMFLDGNVDSSFLSNIVSPYVIPIILIGGSIGIGTILNKLINKKYKTKERFKSFSKSKTEVEKLEEEIRNQIELEKLKNRNKVINSVIENLEDNVSILSKISDKYTVTCRNISQTKEETIDSITKITELLEEKYQELDILVTKKVLHDNFWRVRNQYQKGFDLSLVSFGSGLGTMMVTTLPFIVADNLWLNRTLLQNNTMFISSLLGGAIVPGFYWINRANNRQRAFNNINQTLGDNALPKNITDAQEEEIDLKRSIERTIREISLVEVELLEQKEVLERISEKEDKSTKSNIKEQDKNNNREFCENKNRGSSFEQNDDGLFRSAWPFPPFASHRTERDETMKPGVLYREIEEPQELVEPKKLVRKPQANKQDNN